VCKQVTVCPGHIRTTLYMPCPRAKWQIGKKKFDITVFAESVSFESRFGEEGCSWKPPPPGARMRCTTLQARMITLLITHIKSTMDLKHTDLHVPMN
jgi:hypothetical protein